MKENKVKLFWIFATAIFAAAVSVGLLLLGYTFVDLKYFSFTNEIVMTEFWAGIFFLLVGSILFPISYKHLDVYYIDMISENTN